MTTEATRSYNDKWNYFRSQTNLIFLTVPLSRLCGRDGASS